MKTSTLLSTLVAALALSASTAYASVVDFVGTHPAGTFHNVVDMGHTSIGQTGTLTNWYFTAPFGQITALQTGYIPAHSRIVFTYTGFSTATNAYGYFQGAYNYTSGADNHTGLSFADTTGDYGNTGTLNGVPTPGTALIYATANINDTQIVGTITNRSSTEAVFDLFQWAFLGGSEATATYAVSGVPLPAALPMFSALLMGMFGMRRYTRKTA
ncbi:MAG: hypothetical protein EBV03_06615 [Proteobacteria bacterium]|nr:hypothetical protein [Pseudomonadota bacterium]